MNSRILIIYEYQMLYQVLNEISEGLNCEIIQSSNKNFKELKFDTKNNYLIISKKKIEGVKNSLILNNLPIKLEKLIEMINIRFLKNKFLDQSHIKIGKYKKNVSVKELQKMVWDYSPNLDTHTVETHIYRLRKKMKETFANESFIINTSNGYSID